MENRLARKLEVFGALSEDDRRLLDDTVRTVRRVEAGTEIISEGDRPDNVHLILEGFACRYKITDEGRRQIVAYLVPGDFCDLHVFILRSMDHSIATLSPCATVAIPRSRIIELTERPAIARALWWATLVDEAILREWLVGIGRRSAEQRIAHLFCELLMRLETVGLASGDAFSLPLNQEELGDTVGLSAVHVNRSLQKLREANLISLKHRELVILDQEGLRELGDFDPNYLHLSGGKGTPEHPMAA